MSYNPSGPSSPSGPAYNPGGGPAYTPGGPAAPMMSQAGIQDVVNSWMSSLTRPAIQTFEAEVPRTSQNRTLLSAGSAIVIAAVLSLIGGLIGGSPVGSFISSLITSTIGFVVAIGAYYIGAKVMKGTGTVEQQAWVQSTYWAPITILGAIPIVGFILGILGSLYSLYLSYLMMQAVHRLNSSNAIIAMIIGFVIALVIGFIVALVIGAILLAVGLGAAATGSILGH